MQRKMENELRKIRNAPKYRFHSFVYTNEVSAARARLKDAGVKYKTTPVVRGGKVIGYNILISN